MFFFSIDRCRCFLSAHRNPSWKFNKFNIHVQLEFFVLHVLHFWRERCNKFVVTKRRSHLNQCHKLHDCLDVCSFRRIVEICHWIWISIEWCAWMNACDARMCPCSYFPILMNEFRTNPPGFFFYSQSQFFSCFTYRNSLNLIFSSAFLFSYSSQFSNELRIFL